MGTFSTGVDEKIRWYVYRLVDPRNGETFYVGKGRGNRVFQHDFEADIRANLEAETASEKISRINGIKAAGLSIIYIIHRHGMDERTALHVEAALIDAYPGLTNLVRGHGADDYGVRSLAEIEQEYRAEEAVFTVGRAILLISIGAGWLSEEMGEPSRENILEQTRYSWVLSLKRAEQAEVVLAHARGLVRGAFVPRKWYASNAQALHDHRNFSAIAREPRRFGFVGTFAPEADWSAYVGKRVPAQFRRSTGQPIQYAGSLSSKKQS